ncbi:hypothetical protein NU08_4345 [Flavobacterium anhuiense]|uniref:Uncharacterized protein n=1 Tax=Flavobacterium anhuiense TaxID=459526 RepID=A0A444VT88_9FLAO|nr:hypothetical protein NU08_4345 [Flavobacterium anhuiense]
MLFIVAEQLLESVIVTEYVPAVIPVLSSLVTPSFHKKV